MAFGAIAGASLEPAAASVDSDAAAKVDHTCEYHIRDLGTRSVTLFPTRAQVVRDVKNIPLKAGINQVTIIGLTPTLDEHSVKVEGTGSAIITDLVIELLPNREIFDNTFPDHSENDDDSESDDDDDLSENPELKAVADKICQLSDKQKTTLEAIGSAETRLKFLDAYGRSRAGQSEIDIGNSMEIYRSEREKLFRDRLAGEVNEREIRNELLALQKVHDRLYSRAAKDRAKARATRDKEREKQHRKDLEQAKESERLRKEREAYWPRKTYLVRVTLTSDSDEKVVHDDPTSSTCDLTLSYVTYHAFWSPTYDLALSSTTNSGVLCFDARLTNQTSEAWDRCKIVLSISQTEFSGLSEVIPTLVPWRLRLAGKKPVFGRTGIMYSPEETVRQVNLARERNTRPQRHELFGVERRSRQVPGGQGLLSLAPNSGPGALFGNTSTSRTEEVGLARGGGLFGNSQNPPGPPQRSHPGGLFGSSIAPSGLQQRSQPSALFGSSTMPPESHQSLQTGSAFGSIPIPPGSHHSPPEKDVDGADDQATLADLQPDLEFEESTSEETGLTTTYDLPGLKSLPPSSTKSKQRVARITYSDVVFNRVVVAKHKRAVFLEAKVRNASELTLLKGGTGLTLDGSFLGRSTLPRCSAGDSFTLSLGIDPSIQVTYPKPDVKHASSSVFSLSKEYSGLYSRSITLLNTRHEAQGKPVQVTVRDQIPISEDERLKIELLKPNGLIVNGPGVNTGESSRSARNKVSWGKAVAKLKQGGEVEWAVAINSGCSVQLSLEYSCVVPAGDDAINA
ncbi:hypothetical protein HD806DRAFT_538729 [Xylariaceae sp. AK1471]|nr:hypothetical protein HD806DRAFT_538729 [Xylariaceae sp. AK1471]